jgi:hypothetical protein
VRTRTPYRANFSNIELDMWAEQLPQNKMAGFLSQLGKCWFTSTAGIRTVSIYLSHISAFTQGEELILIWRSIR